MDFSKTMRIFKKIVDYASWVGAGIGLLLPGCASPKANQDIIPYAAPHTAPAVARAKTSSLEQDVEMSGIRMRTLPASARGKHADF